MKVRIVVMSLIFVVAFMLAGCSGETDSAESTQEKRNAAPTIDPLAKASITTELDQAATLLKQAKSKLDEGAKDSEPQAKRFLGYPAFMIADFRDPQGLATRLQTNRELSKYLFSKFTLANKDFFQEEKDDVQALASALREEFDRRLEDRELYVASRFPADNLSSETKLELQRNLPHLDTLTQEELANLNRLLLQDSYREFIKPADPRSVLRHLTQAQKLTKNLSPSDVQRKTQSNVDGALTATSKLLNQSPAESDHSEISSAVDKVSGNVADALASLNRSDDPNTTGGWSIDQIVEVLKKVIYYLLLILAVLIPLAIISVVVKRARDNAAAKEHANVQAFKKLIDRNDLLQQEFTAFKNQNSSEINTLKDQVSRLESAYRILARKNEQYANSSSGNSQNINRYYEPPPAPVKEEPEFPVSAETYLEKMKGTNRFSTVIRPDFQNGILVKDSEGRGELVLIEDPTRPVDFQRLFVVPSVSQFQMKQDFYNYYDGYYECDQPAAGNVWIVHPAIVEKVNGGWRLTEKGRLEVRA